MFNMKVVLRLQFKLYVCKYIPCLWSWRHLCIIPGKLKIFQLFQLSWSYIQSKIFNHSLHISRHVRISGNFPKLALFHLFSAYLHFWSIVCNCFRLSQGNLFWFLILVSFNHSCPSIWTEKAATCIHPNSCYQSPSFSPICGMPRRLCVQKNTHSFFSTLLDSQGLSKFKFHFLYSLLMPGIARRFLSQGDMRKMPCSRSATACQHTYPSLPPFTV